MNRNLPALALLLAINLTATGSVAEESTTKQLKENAALTLKEATERTLRANKLLAASLWTSSAQDARIEQASTHPNPELSIVPENVIGDQFFRDQFQNTVELSQRLELGEKRSNRVALATSEKEKAFTEIELQRNQILSELKTQFVHVLSDQKMLALTERAKKITEETLMNVRLRVSSGAGSSYEEPRTRVLLAHAEIAAEHAEHELLSSRKELATFWNEESLEEELTGELLKTPALPELEQLYSRLESSPRVLQAKADERLKRAVLSLEQSKQTPDATVGIGWRHGRSLENQAAVLSLSIPLQIFDQNQGRVSEATSELSKLQTENEGLPVKMKATVFALFQELKHAGTELELMKTVIIPEVERAFTLVKDGYNLGRYTYLEHTDAQTAVIENHAAQIAAAEKYHTLYIQLHQLLGVPDYDAL